MANLKQLTPTLIALADAWVPECSVDEVIFANAIYNNYRSAKGFVDFVKECRVTFSYRRNALLTKELIKQRGCISWEVRQREVRQPHLLYLSRKYPEYVKSYFRSKGFSSPMVNNDEEIIQKN